MNIRSIEIGPTGARTIVTADWDPEANEGAGAWVGGTDATHRIGTDAPPEVFNREITCGEPYPFTDDEDGNAVAVGETA